MSKIIIIAIVIYILSAIKVYLWTRKAYSIGGIFSFADVDSASLFLTFCPLVNTIVAFTMLAENPRKEKESNLWINKFFGVKK